MRHLYSTFRFPSCDLYVPLYFNTQVSAWECNKMGCRREGAGGFDSGTRGLEVTGSETMNVQ